jgi:membrane-bound lytic murein transglycosylase B
LEEDKNMNMHKKLIQALPLILSILSSYVMADYSTHPSAKKFINAMQADKDFDDSKVISLLKNASKQQSIIDAMNRPAEKVKTWGDYRKIFIQERRINQGVQFWLENGEILSKAAKKYKVPPEIIVAIIGVETSYGRNKGNYRVIDALTTLSFDYPKRSKFFTKQLKSFFILCEEQNQDPLSLKGSYAGAMGYGQFIPSSYRSFAVDFDGDGYSDIWNNKADAIGSVANYFLQHEWKPGEKIIVPAKFDEGYESSVVNKLKFDKNISQLKEMGFHSLYPLPQKDKALPLILDGADGKDYLLGLHNFYVITRYNHSHLYAMAVYELSQIIMARMNNMRDIAE